MARPSEIFAKLDTSTLWTTGSYSYDGTGNVKSMGGSSFVYDKVNRLTSAKVSLSQEGTGSLVEQGYTYDAFGNLTAITGTPGRTIPTNSATNRLETFTTGCIALLAGKVHRALQAYAEARRRFERVGQLRNAGLTATYSIEPYYILGDRERAFAAVAQAALYFEKTGCPRESLVAIAKLRALLSEGASAGEVVATVRRLAKRHGGWLPEI